MLIAQKDCATIRFENLERKVRNFSQHRVHVGRARKTGGDVEQDLKFLAVLFRRRAVSCHDGLKASTGFGDGFAGLCHRTNYRCAGRRLGRGNGNG